VRGEQRFAPGLGFAAPVPETGQDVQYGPGDDGSLERGVFWPNPRFTDNLDGTVLDELTGLIWLQNANCFHLEVWPEALNDANGLTDGQCGLTDGSVAGDWRLPNRFELESLLDLVEFSPALQDGHPFSGVVTAYYWSSTTNAISTASAWTVDLDFGYVSSSNKSDALYAWPVRGGQ